jgi:ribose transport system substrate-binding protein
MKKRFALVLAVLLVAASFLSCSNGAGNQDNGKPTVGFVVKSLADQHWVIVKAGAEAKAKELGVNLVFIAPNAESDVSAQVTMIENLVGKKVNALCVAPSSPDAVLPVFKRADKAGIPIFAIDTDTTFEKRVSFIGTGNEAAAYAGGKYAAGVVGKGAKAIIIRGRLGDKTHDDRSAGLEKALKEGGVEILEIKAADSEAEKAMNAMQDLLNRYPEIDLVCTTSDNMAQGVQRSIEAAKVDTKVMGFDGTIPVVEMTAEGKFLGTTAQSPFNMGAMGVEAAVKVINGETVDARIDTGSEVVTEENAKAFLDKVNKLLGK